MDMATKEEKKQPKKRYLTIVLQYDEPTRKDDIIVTNLLYSFVDAIRDYNRSRPYESCSKVDIYGICVEDEEVANSKNDYMKQINNS